MEFSFPITPQEAGNGRLITFLPLRAGVGASTLACMTAFITAPLQETALIDFTPESKTRSYLGYQGEISASSILDINSITAPEGIFTASEEHHKGIKVFPGISANRLLDATQIDTHLVLKALNYLKKANPFTVAVSEPPYKTGWMAAILSDVICVVAKPDRPNMDAFYPTMELLNRLGCSERVVVILNQVKYPGALETNGAVKYFSPKYTIDYNANIAKDANRREFKPDTKVKNILMQVVKEGLN